ncbi:hypothetical protein Tco_0111129 [Tanacetum coccineum]
MLCRWKDGRDGLQIADADCLTSSFLVLLNFKSELEGSTQGIPLDRIKVLRNWVNTYAIRNTKMLSGIEDSHHGPSDAVHNPPQPLKVDPMSMGSLTRVTGHRKAEHELATQSGRYIYTDQQGTVVIATGEGHMARQCSQPKRPRNSAWFKEKLMLVEAHESGQVLEEE